MSMDGRICFRNGSRVHRGKTVEELRVLLWWVVMMKRLNCCRGCTDDRLRRMMASGVGSASQPINMSLLVIYLWLALVAVMIIITVVFFKYRQPVCQQASSSRSL